MKIDIELADPNISSERKQSLEEEKKLHIDDAIVQRRIWANFVADYVGKTDPNLKLDTGIFPLVMGEDTSQVDVLYDKVSISGMGESGPNVGGLEFPESAQSEEIERGLRVHSDSTSEEESQVESGEEKTAPKILSRVSLQAEDYGGGIALPHYGFRRPSSDYYNSNLMNYSFIVVDITGGCNNLFMYDEREQGKGADALCSLRLRYHLRKVRKYLEAGVKPGLNMSLLDNCVGQNKSQVVMKFACLMSILFYEQVALMYFLPGHTHMVPDRVFGQCKNSIKGLNLYTLAQVVERFNSVKGISAE